MTSPGEPGSEDTTGGGADETLRLRRRLGPGLLAAQAFRIHRSPSSGTPRREGMGAVADRVFVDDATQDRYEQLLEIKFNALQAEALAVSSCTMHDARELIRRKCSHALAFDILSD